MFGEKKATFTINLSSGQSHVFRASAVTLKHNNGKVYGYEIEDGEGDVPFFIDPAAIVSASKQ